MIDVILCGSGGKMGKFIAAAIKDDPELQIVAGVDKVNNGESFPVFSSFDEITVKADVIIDFASAKAVDGLLDYAVEKQHMRTLKQCALHYLKEGITTMEEVLKVAYYEE